MENNKKLPTYLTHSDFDQTELNDVFNGKQIEEKTDGEGNQIVDTSNITIQNSLTVIKQSKVNYSDDKIKQHYDVNFSEFIRDDVEDSDLKIEDDIKQTSDDNIKREKILQDQLDELSKVLELESQKNIKVQEDAEANYKAMKSVIIEKRIENGEGLSESDFLDSFPFLPIKDSQTNPSTANNPLPYVIEPT